MSASKIIATLGGREEVARACGLTPIGVEYWKRRERIPLRHAARIVSLARQKGRPDITESLLLALWEQASSSRTRLS